MKLYLRAILEAFYDTNSSGVIYLSSGIFLWSLAYVRVLLYICGSTAISWILLVLFLLLSTIAIIPHILLCQKSCGMVKYIEISRVPNLCVLFWKRSLIYDAIFDLPYWECVRVSSLRICSFSFVLFVLSIQGRCEVLVVYYGWWEDHYYFCFHRDLRTHPKMVNCWCVISFDTSCQSRAFWQVMRLWCDWCYVLLWTKAFARVSLTSIMEYTDLPCCFVVARPLE